MALARDTFSFSQLTSFLSLAHKVLSMMTLLAEILDKGPTFIQQPILQTLHCILQYVDLAVIQTQVIWMEMIFAIG